MNLGSASLTAGFIIVVFSLFIDKPVLIHCMSVRITSDSFDEESILRCFYGVTSKPP